MDKAKSLAVAATALLAIAAGGSARALTLTVSPNPARVGEKVSVEAESWINATSLSDARRPSAQVGIDECGVTIKFGDGGSVALTCSSDEPCAVAASHTYAAAGAYTLTATGKCGSGSGLYFPAPATAKRSLVVNAAASPAVSIAADPATVRVPHGAGAVATVRYQAAGGAGVNATITSPAGRFVAGGETLGTVPVPLTIVLSAGAGSATETIHFTPALAQAAAARGASSVAYVRDFAGPGAAATATVTGLLVTPAAELTLERVELSFANNRPEIVVRRDEAGLKARARLRHAGSGLLRASWEVDGRILAPPVTRHVLLGERVELESPTLPTFEPGTHTVRLVVASPAPAVPLPAIIYLVRPGDAPLRDVAILLTSPADGETLPFGPTVFRWEGSGGALVFLVQFYAEGEDRPIFSAWSRQGEYLPPELLFRGHFLAGRRYRWQVSAFNAEENVAGTSAAAAFSFASP